LVKLIAQIPKALLIARAIEITTRGEYAGHQEGGVDQRQLALP
jgi:hypothetical protein